MNATLNEASVSESQSRPRHLFAICSLHVKCQIQNDFEMLTKNP